MAGNFGVVESDSGRSSWWWRANVKSWKGDGGGKMSLRQAEGKVERRGGM